MMNLVMPLLVALLGYFKLRRSAVVKQVAENTGLSEVTVGKMGDAVQTLLAPVADVAEVPAVNDTAVDKARQHDTEMNKDMPPLVELLRGVVRPVITLTAFLWYVYARVSGLALGNEDYAIVGGIVAFWFGFRPFEKAGGRLGMNGRPLA